MMHGLVKEFEKNVARGNEENNRHALLGDSSTLAKILRAEDRISLGEAGRCIRGFAESKSECPRVLETIFGNSPARIATSKQLLAALGATLAAAEIGKTGSGNRLVECLESALNGFAEVYGKPRAIANANLSIKPEHQAPPSKRAPHEALRRLQLFQGLDPTAYWIVHDLLERWLGVAEESKHTATSVVLGGIASDVGSGLFHLTIELFPCTNGPMCPDPWYLGVTQVEDSFGTAVRNMWQASGLSGRFRGRWRLVAPEPDKQMELEDDKMKKGGQIFPTVFRGRSAEAALLCTMLAASGDPYQDKRIDDVKWTYPLESEPLNLNVAISATVDGPKQNTDSLLDRPLGLVGRMPSKLKHAYPSLVSVAFSKEELSKRQLARNKDSEDYKDVVTILGDQSDPDYRNLRIERLSAVRDAIDYLLVCNRILKMYQQEVEKAWLGQWDTDENGVSTGMWSGARKEE